jgi:putative ABC transport system permease protein
MVDLYIIFLGGLIVFIAGVGLMNTMTMSVLERRGEVGIMMALGFRPFEVAFVFLVEGILLGILGAIIGVIIASLLAIPLVTTGLTIQSDALANFPYPMEQTLKGSYTVGSVIAGFLVGVLSTLAGTLIPAIQAARMAPVDALRDE